MRAPLTWQSSTASALAPTVVIVIVVVFFSTENYSFVAEHAHHTFVIHLNLVAKLSIPHDHASKY